MAEGKGRAAHYRDAGRLPVSRRYPRAVIAEDKVWGELTSSYREIGALPRDARSVFQYAFTQMLNNAIEHSGSREVQVSFGEEVPTLRYAHVSGRARTWKRSSSCAREN